MGGGLAEAQPAQMDQAERVKLLDAAMQSRDPVAYLDGVQATFDGAGRSHDALIAAVLRTLLCACKVELVMRLRAEWSSDPDGDRS